MWVPRTTTFDWHRESVTMWFPNSSGLPARNTPYLRDVDPYYLVTLSIKLYFNWPNIWEWRILIYCWQCSSIIGENVNPRPRSGCAFLTRATMFTWDKILSNSSHYVIDKLTSKADQNNSYRILNICLSITDISSWMFLFHFALFYYGRP